ncbi:siderophore-iron reductase FhuF [Pandoraea anhela]|uniref:Siderophore-iron reductase FhuF n=1 Tax=Pandoraea anhela TaxID=2508295 RepID=A0A5E4WK82_9BURK|nr:siderophore-iron reductase FhuF [Pandoraea anhela]VVE25212.1 siderophore-iron reductase FhuF [Pandoraea anhela]
MSDWSGRSGLAMPASPSAGHFDLAASLPAPVRGELGPLCAGLAFGVPAPGERRAGDAVIGLADLDAHMPAMFDGVRRIVPGVEPRALMSQWSKFYFRAVAPAALAITIVHGRRLTLDPAACRIVLRGGLPVQLRFPIDSWIPPGAGTDEAQDAATLPPAFERFASLIHVHLPAAIYAMHRASGVSQRVLWSNAGNLLEFIVGEMRAVREMGEVGETGGRHHVPSLASRAARDYEWLFEGDAGFGQTSDNPLYRTVRYVTPPSTAMPTPMRARRVCCLRYQLAGKGTKCDEALLCGSCPLMLTMTPQQLQRQLAMQAGGAPQ